MPIAARPARSSPFYRSGPSVAFDGIKKVLALMKICLHNEIYLPNSVVTSLQKAFFYRKEHKDHKEIE
jgi:hypothetical protein